MDMTPQPYPLWLAEINEGLQVGRVIGWRRDTDVGVGQSNSVVPVVAFEDHVGKVMVDTPRRGGDYWLADSRTEAEQAAKASTFKQQRR